MSVWVGPLSGLSFNRGLANSRSSAWQRRPSLHAAQRLTAALKRLGVRVAGSARRRRTPESATVIASVDSPPMERLIRITNKSSDNFFAEMLLKGLALQAADRGTTRGGAGVAARFARRVGSGVRMVDGSGLSRSNRASPYRVGRLLRAMLERQDFNAFYDSLARAGRDGTLAPRMRGARTGPLPGQDRHHQGVSALSGYCRARSGDMYVFSILMNGVSTSPARRLQDRMAQAIAGVRG